MSTSIDKIGTTLSEVISEYGESIKEKSLKELDETAEQILNYIVSNCPRGNGTGEHLADSFIKTEVGTDVNKIIYISSKTKGRLVHLIELGFKHRSGKHVPARPFLRPAYDTFTPKMLEDIEKIISNGG